MQHTTESGLSPKFSIIVPHYDGVISDEKFVEGMSSIADSVYKNFEVRVYHDGPLNRPLPDLDQFGFEYTFKETKKRYNDWGHSLRDLGIREAQGDYIVHFNPDNLLYKDGLQGIVETISYMRDFGETKIIISPIVLEGCIRHPHTSALYRTRDVNHRIILDGFPAIINNIDCMQLVATKQIWLSIGGWYDKSETSDGIIYQKLLEGRSRIYSSKLLGVHR